ncbi:MAG: anti-sigma factor [Anaerolinea sp.]|nr:anti-sigma factor [Anaerolinea sp.]
MMTDQNECSEILEMLPDYAFGLADEKTVQRVEASLSACPEAVRQLLEYRALQAEMRSSVPQVDPPASLRSRLREIVAPHTAVVIPPPEPEPAAPSMRLRPPAQRSVDITPDLSRRRAEGTPRATRTRPRIVTPAARTYVGLIAGIALALTALAISNIYWLNRLQTAERQLDSFQRLLTDYRTEWFMVKDMAAVEMVSMTSNDSETMKGMLLYSAESPMSMVALEDFPMLTPGRTYQVWLLRETGQPVSAGMLDVDPSGFGLLTFAPGDDLSTYDAVGITEEPAGGSSAPTMPPMILGNL